MSAKVENSAVATGLAKVSFYSNPKERQPQRMLKLLHSCTNFTHWYVRMLECSTFSKLSFTNMWTVNFQLFKLVLEKAEEPEIKWPTSAGSWRILSITLLACEMSELCSSLSILWHCLSLGLEWKLTFSRPLVLLSFPNLLAYWVQHFHSIIFQDLK